MPLQDVEKKVMASAEEEASQILEKAQADAKAAFDRRSTQLRDEQGRAIQAAKADADAAFERDLTTRRADHAMNVLKAKNEVMDAIFDKARDQILASDGFDYGKWLADQVRQACAQGTGLLHANQRDRATVEAVLREANAQNVTLAPETADIQGGVLLTGESFDLDLTLEATLADLRTTLTVSLGERLFADLPAFGEA